MRPGAPSMQQGGCCDDALVDGGGVTAAADMPLLESTSRMSKNCVPIVENQLHVQHQLVALFGVVFHLGRGRLRVREQKFLPNYCVTCVLSGSSGATLSRRNGALKAKSVTVCR